MTRTCDTTSVFRPPSPAITGKGAPRFQAVHPSDWAATVSPAMCDQLLQSLRTASNVILYARFDFAIPIEHGQAVSNDGSIEASKCVEFELEAVGVPQAQ